MNVAVLISGGVDSAVVVHKLKEEGHDLNLFYIRIGMDNGRAIVRQKKTLKCVLLLLKSTGFR